MVGSTSSRGSRGKNNKKYGSKKKSYRGSKKAVQGGGYGKLYAAAGAGVIGVAAIFGWMVLRPKEGETQAAACAILVDRTGSSINEATRASYLELASRMVDGCRDLRASFSVYYFDNQNAKLQTASSDPFDLWRPRTHRKSTGEEKVDEEKKDALAAVGSVFTTASEDSSGGHGSDIVTALSLASQSLQQQAEVEGVDAMYLVVLTDGYQTGELKVTKNSDVPELIRRTEQLGLTPQLKGVDVAFGGVGGGVASNKSQVSADREALVRQYWTSLVESGGGGMCVYNVEPSYLPGTC